MKALGLLIVCGVGRGISILSVGIGSGIFMCILGGGNRAIDAVLRGGRGSMSLFVDVEGRFMLSCDVLKGVA